jgi:ribonuclease G
LFGKTVSFKNGAYLIIDHTEALHVIDVNSGNRSKGVSDQETNALDVNIAAAQEIARQLRLRDMGGIIVVDFIDMHGQEHKLQLLEKMKEFMGADRAKHNILPLSKFGLMQITRQRVRPELTVETYEKCPTCKGTGELAPSIVVEDELFNNISYLVANQGLLNLTLKVHPYLASYLKSGIISKRIKWIFKLRCFIRIEAIPSYNYLEYHFFYKDGEEILE